MKKVKEEGGEGGEEGKEMLLWFAVDVKFEVRASIILCFCIIGLGS